MAPSSRGDGRGSLYASCMLGMADVRKLRSALWFIHLVILCVLVRSELPRKQVLAPRQLFPFQAYKDVQLFHYVVPEQTTMGTWEFSANCTAPCKEQIEVTVSLQHGSYPVIQKAKSQNPSNLATPRQPVRKLKLRLSDLKYHVLNVSSPLPGDWFAAAFYSIVDKRRSERRWLPVRCDVWLSSTAFFLVDPNVLPLVPGYPITQKLFRNQRYRFFATENTWSAQVMLTQCDPCPVWLSVEARVPPSANSSMRVDCRVLHPRVNAPCMLEVPLVAEDDWNYIQVQLIGRGVNVSFQIEINTTVCSNEESGIDDFLTDISSKTVTIRKEIENSQSSKIKSVEHGDISNDETCHPRLALIRQKLPGNFAFRYSRPSGFSEFSPLINISTLRPSLAMFRVMPIVDIGGTFAVEVALPPVTNLRSNNISVTACLQYNQRPRISVDGICQTGFSMYLNSSVPNSCQGKLMVPFPEAGSWYLLLKPKCYRDDSSRNSNRIIDTPCETNTTSLILRLESGPCILGQCGDYGRCYQYLTGGLVFSSCFCTAGRRGWGCTDDSEAYTYSQLLTALLLLTLSNVLYLPVIILAIYRRFFTEALVYLAATAFSALYHACDFEVSPFCVMRLSVLQYCDVYSSALAIWLTLVALSDLPSSGRSMCHMAGALGLALGVEYDRTGLWVFVVPIGAGIALSSISWVVHCYYQRHCYPRKRVWLHLLAGFFLLGCGLVLFAMFEGHRNFAFIHSGRHACLGLAFLCLLPYRRHSKDADEDVMQVNWKPHSSFKFLQDYETEML